MAPPVTCFQIDEDMATAQEAPSPRWSTRLYTQCEYRVQAGTVATKMLLRPQDYHADEHAVLEVTMAREAEQAYPLLFSASSYQSAGNPDVMLHVASSGPDPNDGEGPRLLRA